MYEWSLNAVNTPFAVYVGEIDGGFIRHIEQLVREGVHFEGAPYTGRRGKEAPDIQSLVAEKTPHRKPPEYSKQLDAFHREYVARGPQSPGHVRFATYTTRYSQARWIAIDGLGKHYDRADLDAKRTDNRAQYDITRHNITHLVLRE